MTKRTQQAISTKRKLLYTAYELIRQEGYPALTIRKLCEKSGVSTGAFYHHYHSKEDLLSQGFASFDQELQAYLAQADDADTVGMIRFVVLSLNQYVFDNAAGFAKELYISQLSIKDSYITRKDRPYNRAVLKYVERAQEEHLIQSGPDSGYITDFLLRIGRGTILDWCLHDYSYDLMEQSKKDLDFVLRQFMA